MNNFVFDATTSRVAKAKLARRIGRHADQFLIFIMLFLLGGAIVLGVMRIGHYGILLGLTIIILMIRMWWRLDLSSLPAAQVNTTQNLDQLLPADILAGWRPDLSRNDFWILLASSWQAQFVLMRLGIPMDLIKPSNDLPNYSQIWISAINIVTTAGFDKLDSASILLGWLDSDENFKPVLIEAKNSHDDLVRLAGWIGRLQRYEHQEKPIYGGVARDWAVGYAPLLSRYGQNLSQQVEFAGQQFARQERTNQLETLITTLSSGNGSIAVIGEVGIGKTALLYGLADQLLQSPSDTSLSGYQVIALNASVLLALAEQPGSLERIMLAIFAEANHARNIIIALDEAQLFFGQGAGAVNLSQILLPVLQAKSIRIILTLTPGDWQKLKSLNPAMSSLVSPLVLAEPAEAEVIDLLADRALYLEASSVITYSALRESFRLSSRYFQDEANPGRALKLLTAATNLPIEGYITETSVQRAVEGQLGVHVEKANDQEADVLLHLEDLIHERMVNQTHAVGAVASALRRSRAGVSNPNRPVGSFLFLGPTGVGKTELAKSLAALYYGSENQLIRVDMSEYQQPEDVTRLLESSGENPQGFLTRVRTTPFSVILLDEIEKSHTNILNLLLQMLDEGALTDSAGKPASFKDAIVIATSNAGAEEIRQHISAGEDLEDFADAFNDQLILSGTFKPELINRFDDVILFRPLKPEELGQVVLMMIKEVNETLNNQAIKIELTPEAVSVLVDKGNDPRLGARPMRRMIQRQVEDLVAGRILSGAAKAGDTIRLDAADVA